MFPTGTSLLSFNRYSSIPYEQFCYLSEIERIKIGQRNYLRLKELFDCRIVPMIIHAHDTAIKAYLRLTLKLSDDVYVWGALCLSRKTFYFINFYRKMDILASSYCLNLYILFRLSGKYFFSFVQKQILEY